MSTSSVGQLNKNSDGKIATEPSPPGMNSITNTVGMHRTVNQTSPSMILSSNIQRGSCDNPDCTEEHSGKIHE